MKKTSSSRASGAAAGAASTAPIWVSPHERLSRTGVGPPALALETPRLRLAVPNDGDAADTAAALTPDISRRLMTWRWPMSFADAQARIWAARAAVESGEALHFVLRRLDSGAFVGWTSLWLHQAPGRWRIGYWIAEPQQGQRLATEAALRAAAEAIGRFRPGWLEAVVQPDNCRSIAVLRRLGMKEVARTRLHVAYSGRREVHLVFEKPVSAR